MNIKIIAYKEHEFAEVLHEANDSLTPVASIRTKYHLDFFYEFFSSTSGVGATYIVLEKDYVSKDYLSDYSSYYSTCFEHYRKVCTRVHFFCSKLSIDDFTVNLYDNIIGATTRNKSTFWNDEYVGYIIVKPIPYNFIGFTLLRHYNFSTQSLTFKASRKFWGTRNYTVNVFGNKVTIDSLAFQEQDRNVAACATIAIWSMLQRAAENYYVILRSPSEITSDTGLTNFDGNRLMPNEGLTPPFMANAISKNNLVTEIRQRENHKENFNSYIKKLVYAYSSLGIPILLALKVPLGNNNILSGHAVAVCGHNIEETKSEKSILGCITFRKAPKTYWAAEKIDKLYVHDDQWGPFSRLSLVGKNQIQSSWSAHRNIAYLAETEAVMICLFPKVRISYDQIEKVILGIDQILKDGLGSDLLDDLTWDIQLNLSEDYKHYIRENEVFDKSNQTDRSIQYFILTKAFPKYIWVAKLSCNGQKIFDFIFDATGLTRSNLLHTILGYIPEINIGFLEHLQKNVSNPEIDFHEILSYSVETYIIKLSEIQNLFI